MNRRLFLQFPLLASALTATALDLGRPKKGFKVEAGKDRFEEDLLIMGGKFRLMVSSKDTENDLCIYHTLRSEKGGPAVHVHHHQDEWFYVMRGEFILKVGDDMFKLKAGDSAFAPRTIPHAFAKIDDGEGEMLVLFQPAGVMEDFFAEMKKLGTGVIKDPERTMKELHLTHGMQVLGPPLKF